MQQLKTAKIPALMQTVLTSTEPIIVDDVRAYVGSEKLHEGSLTFNREFGVINANAASVAAFQVALSKDFAAGSTL